LNEEIFVHDGEIITAAALPAVIYFSGNLPQLNTITAFLAL
jgi:hypothetical protein